MRRLTRILLWTAGIVLTLVLVTGVAIQTPFFKQWLRALIVRQANEHLNGTLAIGRISGNLFSGIELDQVSVRMDSQPVVSIDAVKVNYSIRALVSNGTTIESVALVHPVVAVRREGGGWQFGRLVKKDANEADRGGPNRPIAVRHITITNGSFEVDKPRGKQAVNLPRTFDRVNASMSFAYAPVHFTVEIGSMSFAGADPRLTLNEVSGAVTVKDDNINLSKLTVRTSETSLWIDGAIAYRHGPTLALQVSMNPLSLPEIHRIVPAMKEMDVRPNINVTLSGPMSRLATEFSVRSAAVDAAGKGTIGLGGPDRIFQGEIAVHHLDLAPFLNNPEQRSDINVYAKANLRGPAGFDSLKGTVAADAPLVSTHGYVVEGIHANAKIDGRTINFDTSELAYKSNTTSAGSVVFASDESPVTRFDLRGVVKDVGIAYLPKQMRVPPAETKLTANYHVKIDIPRAPGWHLEGDATLATSTVAGVAVGDGATASFAFGPGLVQYRVDMNVADVDLKRIGDQFNFAVLMDERYRTSLNGHVVAQVNGTQLETVDLTASGTLNDSSAFGGRFPEMTFESTLAHDTLHVKASGQVEKINAGLAVNRPSLDSSVTGSVDADVTFSHLSQGTDADSIDGDVTADLGPSTLRGVPVERAHVEGDYHKAFADIQKLEFSGSDVVASGNGTLAFNDTGKSGFWIHAEASHLEQVSSVANTGHSLSGIGTVDAVISGNRKEFVASGTATGSGLKYVDYGALAASTKFTAKMPELDAQRATVTADSQATFVDLPGLQVNQLTAKTTYTDKNVDFELAATQPQRNLTAAGALLLHPDHNEVHLKRLALETQGMSWQTEPGHEAAITYGEHVIGVKDFALVNGMQQIAAEGAYGDADETLTVTLKNVDLGIVDMWLLRPPQLSGTVNAKSVISGDRNAPTADTTFTIANGKFRDVPYQLFTGTVKYTPALLVMDTKLQQNDSQWLTAKGELPFSVIRGKKNAADRIDFHIDSSSVDLGLVQGLTRAVTAVKGTLQAKLDVTGSSAEPRVTGGVTVQGGGFKAEDTGVTYSRLDGRVDFQPDRVHITDLHVLDSENQSLSLTGDLGVSGFDISAVNLGVYADNFKVLANEMGSLRVNTNLELTGTLAHPKLSGELDVATGSINLDSILARLNNSAYSTTAADTAKVEDEPARQGLLGAMDVAVHVGIPDDLIVKATDLKTSDDARVGLGAVNVTLGGNLNVAAGPDRPITLVGSVNTIRGYYDYQGRRFTILRDGSVRFEGDAINGLNPTLDVGAERVIQAVTAHVNVRGRLRHPTIDLTSTPPLEQADILALIVFNQPINQLGAGQQISLAQRAGSIAAGAVTSQLTGSIASSLNLDQFDINLSPDSGSTAELTVGQQLGQNLYVKVQQGIGDHSQTNVVLEYEFSKWLRLQTNVLEGANTQQQLFQRVQSTGLDLVFSFAFK